MHLSWAAELNIWFVPCYSGQWVPHLTDLDSTLWHRIEPRAEGSRTPVLESYCAAAFSYSPTRTQLNQMAELSLQCAIKFGKGLVRRHSFHSGLLEQGCIWKLPDSSSRGPKLETWPRAIFKLKANRGWQKQAAKWASQEKVTTRSFLTLSALGNFKQLSIDLQSRFAGWYGSLSRQSPVS